MTTLLSDLRHEFTRHKRLVYAALNNLPDEAFFQRPGPQVNPIALILKHLAGNFASRWTDFLTTDGDKPDRNRDGEFVLTDQDSRSSILDSWERGWQILFATMDSLSESDLEKPVTIRGEVMSARQALLRGATHLAYHSGQILYLARLLNPESRWLTIAPGESRSHPGTYLK